MSETKEQIPSELSKNELIDLYLDCQNEIEFLKAQLADCQAKWEYERERRIAGEEFVNYLIPNCPISNWDGSHQLWYLELRDKLKVVISSESKIYVSDTGKMINDEPEQQNCPECGSTNIFDLEVKMECEDCGYTWTKQKSY